MSMSARQLPLFGPRSAWQPEWHDLEYVIPYLVDAAEKRENQKQRYASTRPWAHGGTHLRGLIGEYVYGVMAGRRPDLRLLVCGDHGADIGDVDVKTSTFIADPDLKVVPSDLKKPARFYALVAYDEHGCRAAYYGYATREEVQRAPRRNYGHGDMLSLNWRVIHRGLPR